jgi:hypothetical protein
MYESIYTYKYFTKYNFMISYYQLDFYKNKTYFKKVKITF